MSTQVRNNLIIIGFLLLFLASIWVLNQKKYFNPVLSFKTNLSFKSDKKMDYKNLSSTYTILRLLQEKYPDFNLEPAVSLRDFAVIGRVISNKTDDITVFEYASNSKAKIDYQRLLPIYNERMILYKNLVIVTKSENETLYYLKEKLK